MTDPSPQRGLPDDGVREKVAEAVIITPSDLQDHLIAAYEQGAHDTHTHYRPDPDPDFKEAAWDYVAGLDFTETTRPYRLLDQPPARAEGEWRTIESAPKDGTEVLVSGETLCTSETMPTWRNPGSVGIASFRPSGPTLQWRGEGAHAHDEYLWWRPTHWMPLPAAPPLPGQEGGQPLDATERPGKV